MDCPFCAVCFLELFFTNNSRANPDSSVPTIFTRLVVKDVRSGPSLSTVGFKSQSDPVSGLFLEIWVLIFRSQYVSGCSSGSDFFSVRFIVLFGLSSNTCAAICSWVLN